MPKLQPDLSTWWTTERVSQELGVKPRTVHHHVQSGNLHPQKHVRPGVEGGAVNLFDPAEVEAFLQKKVDRKTELVPVHHPGPLVRQKAPRDLAVLPFPVPLQEKLYVSLEEAMALTGLGRGYILTQLEGQKIGPHGRLVFRVSALKTL
jgi:hypothetical protein